jgi:hypothetical protein
MLESPQFTRSLNHHFTIHAARKEEAEGKEATAKQSRSTRKGFVSLMLFYFFLI